MVAEPIRYFFDEHLPTSAAVALRARGIDVVRVPEVGRLGFLDIEQLRFATAVSRTIVTNDADYLELAVHMLAVGETFAGIAFCPRAKYQANVGGLVRALTGLHARATADEMLNHLEYL